MRKNILIVDDHTDLRQLVSITLECSNYRLSQAASADEALRCIEDVQPDLMVLDVMMPGEMNGYQLCEKIKKHTQYQSIKVILLTARGQQADIQEGIRVKSDAYLVKPFSPLMLLKKVDELLDGDE
ncbi:MAG: response regulator [Methylovulum sp.]|nr:response regulator [Methylovulum sp.]